MNAVLINVSPEYEAQRQTWLDLVQAAGLSVATQPVALIGAITVTRRFGDLSAVERRLLLDLARELADDCDLAIESEVDSGSQADRGSVRGHPPGPKRTPDQLASPS